MRLLHNSPLFYSSTCGKSYRLRFSELVRNSHRWAYSLHTIKRTAHSPVAGIEKRAIPSVQCFLLFLYLWGELFENLNDVTLSSLGNPPKMQIKAAITENPSFVNISVAMYVIKIILLSIPMFWEVKNNIKPFSKDYAFIFCWIRILGQSLSKITFSSVSQLLHIVL